MKHLKNIAGVLLFALLSTLTAFAGKVGLAWDANPEPDIAGYTIYYGSASRTYTNQVDAGTNLTCVVSNLTPGVNYYFAATARNTSGLESDLSEEVWLTMPTSNIVFLTMGATNMTRTNVALVGVVSNMPPPYAGFFEYIVGTTNDWHVTNVLVTSLITVTNESNYVFQAVIPVVPTNYAFRLVITNSNSGAFLYVAGMKQFRTVPPSTPTHIKFKTTIIQADTLTSTNWNEVMTASVTKDYPPQGIGFFRSRMDYEFLTNHPPDEIVVVNYPTPDPQETADEEGGSFLRVRPASLGPPAPGQ